MRTFGGEVPVGQKNSNFVKLVNGVNRFRLIPMPYRGPDGKTAYAASYIQAHSFWASSLDEKGTELRRPVVTKVERETPDGKSVIDVFTIRDAEQILLPTGQFLSKQYDPKERFRTLVWDYQADDLKILDGPAWNMFARIDEFARTAGPLSNYDITVTQTPQGDFPQRNTDIYIPSLKTKMPEELRAKIAAACKEKRDELIQEMTWTIATVEEVAKMLNGRVVNSAEERDQINNNLIPEGTQPYEDPFSGGVGMGAGAIDSDADVFGADDSFDF